MAKNRITIKDIAKDANVTPASVSMALKDHPRISKDTRRKIQRIAKKMGYQPNFLARALVSKKSFTIGVTVPHVTDSFYAELLQGIEDGAVEFAYNSIHCSTKNILAKERSSIDLLMNRGVDGLIISSAENEDPYIKGIIDDEFPLVMVNRRLTSKPYCDMVDYVVPDNFSGADMAMEHLYRLGHRRIGVITGLPNTSTGKERTDSARQFLKHNRIKIESKLFVHGGWNKKDAYNATNKLLKLPDKPTAIFSASDEMALAAREAILDAGLDIPSDIALIGFDNIASAKYKGIELSSVGINTYEMGKTAAKIMVEKIENKISPMINKVTMKPELFIRRTCGFHPHGYTAKQAIKKMVS
jgi:LacI family transcriptional regulator